MNQSQHSGLFILLMLLFLLILTLDRWWFLWKQNSHWTKTFVSYLVGICADTSCPHIVQNDAINHLPAEELTACRNVLAGACLFCPWLQKDHSSSRWYKPEFTSFQPSSHLETQSGAASRKRKPPRLDVKVTEATPQQQLWNCGDTSSVPPHTVHSLLTGWAES